MFVSKCVVLTPATRASCRPDDQCSGIRSGSSCMCLARLCPFGAHQTSYRSKAGSRIVVRATPPIRLNYVVSSSAAPTLGEQSLDFRGTDVDGGRASRLSGMADALIDRWAAVTLGGVARAHGAGCLCPLCPLSRGTRRYTNLTFPHWASASRWPRREPSWP
jgi:hypothetical protein